MTSRISFSKMVKSDIKRRLWVLALLFLGFFIVLPVGSMMRLEGLLDNLANEYITFGDLVESVANMVGAGNALVMLGVATSAILTAFSSFSYLHSSRKVDLFHSFAVKRERLFAAQYVSGLLIFLLPYLTNVVLMMIVCAVNGLITGAVISTLVVGILVHLIYFLLLHHVTIIAIVLTGKLLVSVLGLIVFCGWSFLTSSTIISYFSTCFDTFYQLEAYTFERVLSHLSPVEQYFRCAAEFYTTTATPFEVMAENAGDLVIAFVEAAVFLLAAVWLYNKRPSEAAGNAMAFPKWNPVIKVWMLIPLSAFGGLFALQFSSNRSLAWLIFGIIFTAIVAHCLIEVIYSYDFRKVLAHKCTLGISTAVVLIFACVCWFDVIGYDEMLPESEDLQSMAVSVDCMDNYVAYQVEDDDMYRYYNQEIYRLEHGQMSDVTAAYQLAKIGVENEKTDYFETQEAMRATGVIVSYVKKNGKEMLRRYQVSYDQLKPCIASLYATENFKNGQYPLLDMDADELVIINAHYSDAYHDDEVIGVTIQQNEELFLCYQKELAQLSYDDMQAEDLIGALRFSGMEGEYLAETYFVYESFTETLAMMEEFGYPMQRLPDIEDVSSVMVYNYEWEERMYESYEEGAVEIVEPVSGERIFEDPENIETILQALVSGCAPDYQTEQHYDVQVEINLKDDKGKNHLIFGGYFKEGEVPQCVLDAYQE